VSWKSIFARIQGFNVIPGKIRTVLIRRRIKKIIRELKFMVRFGDEKLPGEEGAAPANVNRGHLKDMLISTLRTVNNVLMMYEAFEDENLHLEHLKKNPQFYWPLEKLQEELEVWVGDIKEAPDPVEEEPEEETEDEEESQEEAEEPAGEEQQEETEDQGPAADGEVPA